MTDKTDKPSDVSALMDQLNLLTVKSFPESNSLPVMRVLDDGSVLYSNPPARQIFAGAGTEDIWDIPRDWMPYLERALTSGQSTMSIHQGEKCYDLLIIGIDPLSVNIYAYDVSEREQALQALQRRNAEQKQRIAEEAAKLAKANKRLSIEKKRYKALRKEMKAIAMQDELTGLPNRRCFAQAARHAMLGSRRTHTSMAVMTVALNYSKRMHDGAGCDTEDLLLREAAGRLRKCVRELDMPARFEGDEFAVLAEGFSCTHDVRLPVQRIIHALAHPFAIAGRDIIINASIGVSIFPGGGDSLKALLNQSAQAMRQARASGGDYLFCQDAMPGTGMNQMARRKQENK